MSIQVDRRAFLGTAALALANSLFNNTALAQGVRQKGRVVSSNPPTLKVSEVITRGIPGDFQSYLRVDTGTPGWFYIGLYKETHNQKISTPVYDPKDKRERRLFSKTNDPSKPVATVDLKGSGIEGVFNIYDTGDGYKSSYPINPLLDIPSHTEVSTNYLLGINNALNKLPGGVIDALNKDGTELMIAKNIEDSYYWLYPAWKKEDQNRTIDPSKPWLEKVNGEWIDNRKHENIPGYYLSEKSLMVMPQQYIEYGTRNQVVDRTKDNEWNQSTVFHETGHAIDYLPSSLHSDEEGFVSTYNKDMEKIPDEEEERVGYFLKNRREPFAEIAGALMGGLSSSRSARIFDYFPSASEHIRKNVLPKYGYKVSQEQIRRSIYPGYGLERHTAVKLYPEMHLASSLAGEDMVLCC